MNEFISNLDLVDKMISEMHLTTSMNEKKSILKKYSDNPFILRILKQTYNPDIKYGIHKSNLEKNSNFVSKNNIYGEDIFSLLDDLSRKDDDRISGNYAISVLNSFIDSVPQKYRHIIYGILSHDLNIGITQTTISKQIPNLLPTFKVALANSYEGKDIDFGKETWFSSRKLDGIRCICRKQGDNVSFFSRTGKVFHTLGALESTIKNIPGDFVLDGEICIFETDNQTENFTAVVSEIHKKNHTIENVKYFVFDCLKIDEFDSAGVSSSNDILSTRLERTPIRYIIDNNKSIKHRIELLPQVRVKDIEHFTELVNHSKKMGHEGIMIRKDIPYEGKRSKNLLKVKQFKDDEYEVIGAEMGIMRWIIDGKNVAEECLTNIKVKHKGSIVSVGSGFSKEQRDFYYKNPEKIVGKKVCIEYFEESKNKKGEYSLRFPTIKHVYDGERLS
jgi:DNA ligase 1